MESNAPFYVRYAFQENPGTWVEFPSSPHTSFVIRVADLEEIQLQIGQEATLLSEDLHGPDLPEHKQSIQFFNPESRRVLLKAPVRARVEILLFNASMSKPHFFARQNKSGRCNEPVAIPQSVWRSGLPAPTATPAFTQVKHLIVHHSAGSGPSGDATQTVRDIYLLHTEGNGWDDIGYNYLVSPNGTLFMGRDPQGLGAQDEVRGAHFCGKNSNTMGVCLLGDYMQTNPSDTMIGTLQSLLVWKYFSEQLNPLGQSLHPQGDPDAVLLNHLAGHRNGCATSCPGDRVFSRLSNIRDAVYADYNYCLANDLEEVINQKVVELRQTDKGAILYNHTEQEGSYEIRDMQGRLVFQESFRPSDNRLPKLDSGWYIVKVQVDNREFRFKYVGR